MSKYLLPSLLTSAAPSKTPGKAMAPNNNCHSAVRLRVWSLTTEAMIVPEKMPFGKLNGYRKSMFDRRQLIKSGRARQPAREALQAHSRYEIIQEPDTRGTEETGPVAFQSEPVGHFVPDRVLTVQCRVDDLFRGSRIAKQDAAQISKNIKQRGKKKNARTRGRVNGGRERDAP